MLALTLVIRRPAAAVPSRLYARADAGCVREIQATFEGTVLALGRASELRDDETRGQPDRVVAWTDRVTERPGVDPVVRRSVRWGA